MKILSLDISTSTGIAYFHNNKLVDYFNFKVKNKVDSYPESFIKVSEEISVRLTNIIIDIDPDFILIEETNKGKNRFSQKQLEFIHCLLLFSLRKTKYFKLIVYIDTSDWRSTLGIALSSDQRVSNKEVKEKRNTEFLKKLDLIKQNNKHILNDKLKYVFSKREQNKIIKDFEKESIKQANKEMKVFKTPVKKISFKDLSVDYVNNYFNLKLKKKDNDIADAICIGLSFIQKNNYV